MSKETSKAWPDKTVVKEATRWVARQVEAYLLDGEEIAVPEDPEVADAALRVTAGTLAAYVQITGEMKEMTVLESLALLAAVQDQTKGLSGWA